MAFIKSVSGFRGTIGGKVGHNLTPLDILRICTSLARWLKKESSCQLPKVVIGRDGRISGRLCMDLLRAALESTGVDIVDLGLSTTPTVEMAVVMEKANAGIVVTASHNPMEWNGLKFLNKLGEPLSQVQLEEIINHAKDEYFYFSSIEDLGKTQFKENYIKKHVEAILNLDLIKLEVIRKKNFKIVVDSINSTGSLAVSFLLKSLGVKEIIEINNQINGKFARNPEPLEENLGELSARVLKEKADLGIALDPDVDRLVFICQDGKTFGEEYTLVAVADYVLKHKKGPVVSNLSSSRALQDLAINKGVFYFSSAVGEVNVIEKMKEVSAVIGGEGNGGIIYPDLHYGRDALVGIALFLMHLACFSGNMTELKKKYPLYYISKNKLTFKKNIEMVKLIDFIKSEYKNEEIDLRDGIKVTFNQNREWIHLRKSNTEPIIRIYVESESKEKASVLRKKFSQKIKNWIS